jgi:hypothetical protein
VVSKANTTPSLPNTTRRPAPVAARHARADQRIDASPVLAGRRVVFGNDGVVFAFETT